MRIFISIISHGHQSELMQSGLLPSLANIPIVIRENLPHKTREITSEAAYFCNLSLRGFGANHNLNFEALSLADDDWFVICNPDILATEEHFSKLVDLARADNEAIAVPYLHNAEAGCFDHNVRPWPTLVGLLSSFLGLGVAGRYREKDILEIRYPDWASGAVMAIRADIFRALGGFDESYFMYMEDVDFCRRAAQRGLRVRFYPSIEIVHNAARKSRKLFSLSFRQHLASACRYFWKYSWR